MRHLRYALPLLLQALTVVTFAQQGETDSLLTIVRQNKRDKAEAMALNDLAFIYSRTDLPRSIACLHESKAIAMASNIVPQLINAYGLLVVNQQDMGHNDSALYYLNKLKPLVEAHPEYRLSYTHAAGMYYKRLLDFRSALPFLLESLDEEAQVAKADSSVLHLTNLAGAYLNLGNTVTQMGDYKGAQRYQLEALTLFEKVGNKKGISYCYQMLGNNFLQLHQLKQASDYTRKGLALKTELKDTRGVATGLQQLGAIFLVGHHFDSALNYYQRTLEIDQGLGLKLEEASMNLEIGNCYKDIKNDSAAERYFEHGRALSLAIGDTARVATFDAALTSVRKNGEDPQLIEQQLLNTMNTAIRTKDMTDLPFVYKYLAEHYANTGQTKKAFEYVKKYYGLNDSLGDLNTQIQLRKMEGQYNVEKKEQEIALLKKDQQLSHVNLEKQKAVLTAQNAVLEKQKFFQYGAMLLLVLLLLIGFLVINRYRIVHRARRAIELERMRNHIARDLHDDIGSTLSSINILSKVALQSPAADSPRNSLEKIMSRSAAIMEKMDDIVWTINPQNDTMEQLLYRMKEFAAEILEPLNINYTFEANDDFSSLKLDIRRRKDLYLIFKEAVNNAAKYSQCSNLHIRLRRDGDSLQLEITDDGKGFAAETIKAGNGLNNMRERAAAMLARIKIDSAIGRGTRIDLDLPIT